MTAPKLTVHETAEAPPSATAELLKAALQPAVLRDAKGREVHVRKPSPLAQFRIVSAVGPQNAANQTYMQMVNPLIYVSKIGDHPILLPANLREVEALIELLDDDGLETLMTWYLQTIVQPAMDAATAAEERDRLKN